jgi:hypothetical protein
MAIDLIRLEEAEIVDEYPHLLKRVSPYACMLEVLDPSRADDEEALKDRLIRPMTLVPEAASPEFHEFTYFSEFTTLNKCVFISPTCNSAKAGPYMHAMKAADFRLNFPTYVPKWPKWDHEDRILCQMLLDMKFHAPTDAINQWHKECGAERDFDSLPFTYDIVTKGLVECMTTGKLGVWQVLGARVILDTVEIFGEFVSGPYTELLNEAGWATRILDNAKSNEHSLEERGDSQISKNSDYFQRNDELALQVTALRVWIKEGIKQSPIVSHKTHCAGKTPGLWLPAEHGTVLETGQTL